MVYHKNRVINSIFRKLPFGAAYWLVGGTYPLIKTGRTKRLAGPDASTAVADVSVAVKRVPKTETSEYPPPA